MKLQTREKELLMICLALSLIILGVMSQYFVIISNNCQMPVPEGDYKIELTEKHFFFDNSKDINLYYLSDIIPFFNNQISIGDIFIFIGIILSFGFVGRYIIKLYA